MLRFPRGHLACLPAWVGDWGWRTHTRDWARRRRPADVMGINQEKYLRGHENVIITFKTVIKRQSFIEINTVIKRNDGISYSTDVVTSASPAAPRVPGRRLARFVSLSIAVLLYQIFSSCLLYYNMFSFIPSWPLLLV